MEQVKQYIESKLNLNNVEVSVEIVNVNLLSIIIQDKHNGAYASVNVDIPLLKAVRLEYLDSSIHKAVYLLMKVRYYNDTANGWYTL